jgi:hypothetical protein
MSMNQTCSVVLGATECLAAGRAHPDTCYGLPLRHNTFTPV